MNAAVFAALKPGGLYVIADHAGRPGTGISESGTLHRVEEAFVRREVEAAGFRLAAAGDFLRNPADPRDREDARSAAAQGRVRPEVRQALGAPSPASPRARAPRAPAIGTPAAAFTSFSTTLERMCVTPGSLNAVRAGSAS